MNTKHILWMLTLAVFLAFTTWAFARADFFDLCADFFRNPVSLQVGADLTVSMVILLGFIWKDARKRGLNPVPYCITGIFLGSIGPMIYLVRRGFQRQP